MHACCFIFLFSRVESIKKFQLKTSNTVLLGLLTLLHIRHYDLLLTNIDFVSVLGLEAEVDSIVLKNLIFEVDMLLKSLLITGFFLTANLALAEDSSIYVYQDESTLLEIGSFDADLNFNRFSEMGARVCSWQTVWDGTKYVRMRVCTNSGGGGGDSPSPSCRWVTTYDHNTGQYVRVRVCS